MVAWCVLRCTASEVFFGETSWLYQILVLVSHMNKGHTDALVFIYLLNEHAGVHKFHEGLFFSGGSIQWSLRCLFKGAILILTLQALLLLVLLSFSLDSLHLSAPGQK